MARILAGPSGGVCRGRFASHRGSRSRPRLGPGGIIPLPASADTRSRPTERRPPDRNLMSPRLVRRVLVVEDSRSLRQSLMRALEGRFEEVRGAASVAEARAELAAFLPDLLLLDVEL